MPRIGVRRASVAKCVRADYEEVAACRSDRRCPGAALTCGACSTRRLGRGLGIFGKTGKDRFVGRGHTPSPRLRGLGVNTG
jgi:hypothetical protein